MHLRTWQLFAVCVLVWGTTWYAITWQIHTAAPEVAVAIRFALAGVAVLVIAAGRGERLALGASTHAFLALQGIFMYGVSYVAVYHAEAHVPSGLVAVGYSASPLLAGFGARWLFGTGMNARFVIGGVLGIVGVALIFWGEIAATSARPTAALGVIHTVAAVLLAAVGALAASRNGRRGLPFWSALGFGMVYGALSAAVVALVLGRPWTVPSAPIWWGALAYLALAGSVLTFACFLTLQQRVGPGPASTVGVMTPILALGVSFALEGYRPDVLALVGVGFAIVGNVMMLRRPGGTPAVRREACAAAAE